MTEVFVEPELDNLQDADTAHEWFALCVELGLDKQAALADKSKELKAPPYMFIDPRTERIIKTLCPVGTKYKEYNTSTIPLDILQEIHKCEKNGWYEEIYIFHDNKSPDPFVVGEYKTGQWDTCRHLIARWGGELLPFEILEQKAVARLVEGFTPHLAEMKATMEFALSNTEAFVKSLLGGKNVPKLDIETPQLNNTWSMPF